LGEHAEVALAVDARRRHQGDEAVEQLERRQEQ
jgi:ribosomal protein L13E